ncbi:MAG: gamma carbonic anhydrase family protein [Micrococcales bacterium]|nr:MAG: gamma carbonic anhydrase family protein [Micrococcales bacterium]
MRIHLDTATQQVHPQAWVAPGAVLIGAVHLHEEASVWYGCVLRGDGDLISIGARSNLQDLTVVHADPGKPVAVGRGVSVGHRAVLHGCTVEEDVLIGMGSTVMNHAHIGRGSIVGAGALIPEGMKVPPGTLVLGMPAAVKRKLTDQEHEAIAANASAYCELVQRHRSGRVDTLDGA